MRVLHGEPLPFDLEQGAKDSLQLAIVRLKRAQYPTRRPGDTKKLIVEALEFIKDAALIQRAAFRRHSLRRDRRAP